MNINTRAKALIGAVAIGGAAVAMGGAFTAGGINANGQNGDQFVGGSVSQEVVGATLSSVSYDLTEETDDLNKVTVTFSAAIPTGHAVTASFIDDAPANTITVTCVDAATARIAWDCTPTGAPLDVATVDTVKFVVATA